MSHVHDVTYEQMRCFANHSAHQCTLTGLILLVVHLVGACGQLVVEHSLQKGCKAQGIKDLEDLVPSGSNSCQTVQ